MCFINTFCAYPVIQKYIIDPYYEARGERNPEYARYENVDDGNVVFEDKGGEEAPTEFSTGREKKTNAKSGEKVQVKTKGKVIK